MRDQAADRGQRRACGLGSLVLLCCLLLLGGCALPGYSGLDNDDGGYWYAGDGDKATWPGGAPAEEIKYDARMVLITPQLIRHMEQERTSQPLDPDVKALMADPANSKYEVGPGDVLQVIVFGQEQLNNPMGDSDSKVAGQLVSATGTVYFPYVGEIEVAGLTLEQIREKIAAGLSTYIRQPQVDVRVRKFRSKRVFISGDIAKPCTVPLTTIPLTVLRALNKCETLVSPQQEGPFGIQNVVLIRDGEATQLSLNELYRHGTPVPLQAGDRLIVDDSASRVFMVGEFEKQLALPYSTGGMTLGDAIADAGGINLATADASSIYVIRGFMEPKPGGEGGEVVTLRPKVFHLDASSVNALLLANRFHLKPRDIVFAAPASMVNFNRALALLTPTLDTLFRSFLLYDRASDN